MTIRIKRYVGVSTDKKEVTIVKTERENPNAPGRYELPEYNLSTGEYLTPLDKEHIKFKVGETEIKVGIVREK